MKPTHEIRSASHPKRPAFTFLIPISDFGFRISSDVTFPVPSLDHSFVIRHSSFVIHPPQCCYGGRVRHSAFVTSLPISHMAHFYGRAKKRLGKGAKKGQKGPERAMNLTLKPERNPNPNLLIANF